MTTTSYVLVVAGWAAGTVLLWRVRTPAATTATGYAHTVSVVIPARNEERNLPRLLASLAAQVELPLEVLVVDDDSDDRTAALARAGGVGVVESGPLRDGWLGKPWACQQGVDAASGERLLFLDADTWLAPDGIARLVAAQVELANDGLLSVQPFHRVERPYEQLSAVCNVVPILASGMAAPRDPRRAVAFGPCLLTRADALAAAGGFAAVRGEIVEDAALARAYRAAGRPVRCLGGGSTVAFRMYPHGVASLVEGWTKNLSGGATRVAAMPLIGAVVWVTAGLSVSLDAVTDPAPVVLAAYVAFAAQLWWMLRRLGSFHWLTAALFPVPLLAFVALFLRSTLLRLAGRPVAWRGRRIDTRR